MSVFTFNGASIAPPPGTISSYLGTTDPDGWVICDGQTRTATDNRYSALATILNTAFGVSTNNGNSITPPDLRNRFLYGRNLKTDISDLSGSSTVTLTISNMPAHNHAITITDPGHAHDLKEQYEIYNRDGASSKTGGDGSGAGGPTDTNTNTTGITATSANVGSGTAFSILPPHLTVNHILKY